VGGQDELERESRYTRTELVCIDVAEPLECIGQGLARRVLILRGVLSASTQAVMLLGDVDQLEIEAESPQNIGLIDGRQHPHGVADGIDVAGFARIARTQPDPLLGLEQLVASLLDEDLAEDAAEQSNVATEWGIGLSAYVRAHEGELSARSGNDA
jgi:hypothetical protein